MAILGHWKLMLGAGKTVVLRVMWALADKCKRVQRGVIVVTSLESIFVISWQRMWCFLPLS